jgi:acetyl esterase/lipase
MKLTTTIISICLALLTTTTASAQTTEKLWPAGPPAITFEYKTEEVVTDRKNNRNPGEPNRAVTNISMPTFTVHRAPGKSASTPAVVVFPGGGFRYLEIDKEGHEIAHWLNTIGITGIVVKYRTRPEHLEKKLSGLPPEVAEPIMAAIVADGKRAIRTVRSRAAEWGIDPDKIGTMGFSAGAFLTASTMFEYDEGDKKAADPIERVSSRPDFAAPIYGGSSEDSASKIHADLPPVFLATAADDKLVAADRVVNLYLALHKAGVSAELHVYAKGGHGFGLGRNKGPVSSWTTRFEDWLRSMKIL